METPSCSRSGNILTVEGRAREDLASIRRLGRLTSNGLLLGNRKELLGRAVDLVEPGLRSLDWGLGWGVWNSDRLLPAAPICLPQVNDHPRILATSA